MTRGFIRIIGGQWRGRKLKILDKPALRPTPDRVRETLFNWLAPYISGAFCLDAFAGSGALGLEALSRGAKQVVMVDACIQVITLLKAEAKKLNTSQVEIYCAQVPQQLKPPVQPFNIVFLDPPYQKKLLLPCCFYLEENHFLAKEAYIYLESAAILEENDLPKTWQIIKNKKAGQVTYALIYRYGR